MQNKIRVSAMQHAWSLVQERFAAYALLIPGDSSFDCLSTDCPAHCCRKYSVSLGEAEVHRMVASSGRAPIEFLETEDGEPIAFPLAQPFMLSRTDGACTLLGTNLLCSEYEGRPDACRQYPHHILFIDTTNARPIYGDLERMAAGIAWYSGAAMDQPDCIPVLVKHLDCPGFGGEALPASNWVALIDETVRLQYADLRPYLDGAVA